MTHFNIAIVSDTVCPWCYIGKKRLEKGIAQYKALHPESNDTFSTEWFPFYLDPDAPKESISKKERFERKFGAERMEMMQERVGTLGKTEGINFKWGGKTGNTRDSHRLIQLAKTKSPELQTKVVETLFEAYFENEEDITSHDVLQKAAVQAGLDETEVKEWLASDKGGPEVDDEVADAQRNFVSGVPNFTVQDKYVLEGAQDSSDFVEVFEEVKLRKL